jgi:hypothetical protein
MRLERILLLVSAAGIKPRVLLRVRRIITSFSKHLIKQVFFFQRILVGLFGQHSSSVLVGVNELGGAIEGGCKGTSPVRSSPRPIEWFGNVLKIGLAAITLPLCLSDLKTNAHCASRRFCLQHAIRGTFSSVTIRFASVCAVSFAFA